MWLGPHDRIMCPHNRSAPRASPHDRIMRSWIHHGCTMNLWPHDWIMRPCDPRQTCWPWVHKALATERFSTRLDHARRWPSFPPVLYSTVLYWIMDHGSRIKDQGSRTLDLGPCSGMNGHPGMDADVRSRHQDHPNLLSKIYHFI